LPLLTVQEEREQVAAPTRTARDRRPDTLTAAFERARRRYADRPALVDATGTLTYAGTARAAAGLGGRLRTAAGVGAEGLVAVLVSRDDKRWVVACLAALHAGAAWLPLDPAIPQDRLAALLRDARVAAVVCDGVLRDRIPAGDWAVVDVDEPGPWSGGGDGIAEDAEDIEPPAPTDPGQLAYAMYTSGSTGSPRAVLVEHDGAVNFVQSLQRLFALAPEDRMLQYASPGFDVSVFEIFCALLSGASLHMIGDDDRRSVAGLTRALAEGGITVAELPPALLELLDPDLVPALRLVSVGGEPFSGRLTTRWSQGRRFVNGYGTTETTIGVIYKECTGLWRSPPPIGRPVDNHQAYVLDDRMRPVPPGAVGELYVGGAGVARGYLGRPARTAECFVPDPFRPGGRLYATGDLARWSADADLVFLGRRDRQVKVRGQRVELGEIEAALAALPEVATAVVADLDATLTAFLVAADGHRPDPDAVRSRLAERLPSYMVPGRLVEVEQVPITASGKVDLAALAARLPAAGGGPSPAAGARSAEGAGRSGLVDRLVAEGYGAVLPGAPVAADTNFFAAGGDSLRAIRLLSWVREAFGAEIPMSRFFRQPTPEALAAAIERQRTGHAAPVPAPSEAAEASGPPAETGAEDGPEGGDAGAPLSSAQQRLWFLDQLNPGDSSYNVTEVLRLRGDVDAEALRRALHALAERHEILRTRYVATAGVPRQVVDPAPGPAARLRITDLSGAGQAEVDALLADSAAEPFDLATGPLLRVDLVRRAPHEHLLVWTIHHTVADGRATEVLFRELSTLYNAFHAGAAADLPAVPVRFRDYARRQRAWLGGEEHRRDLAYWRERLRDAPGQPELPADRPRPAQPTNGGASLAFELPAELGPRLDDFGARSGMTSFMTLLTVFFALLSRYGREKDVVVGTPFANRTRREIEDLVGFLVNTVPLRADCAGDPTFAALLRQVADTTLAAADHAELPFEELVSGLGVDRDARVNPLVQVIFQVIDAPEDQLSLDGLDVAAVPVEERATAFDLVLEVRAHRDGRLSGRITYSTDLFDRPTVERIAGHYGRLLASALAAPDRRLSELELLTPVEHDRIVGTFNETVSTPVDTVTAVVERQAAAAGAAVAVSDRAGRLTYAELNGAANRLARHLRGLGAGRDTVVAVCLPPGTDLFVAMLAVLKSGAAYLPLDPAHPAERIAALIDDCGVDLAVGDRAARAHLPAGLRDFVALDDDRQAVAALPSDDLGGPDGFAGPDPQDLAYVIHTSGSTGRPKGVAVPHHALVRLMLGCDAAPVGPDDVLLMMHPANFDASNLEIWLPLAHGASVVVPPERLVDPVELGAALRRHAVSVLWLPAALAQLIVDTDPHLLDGVRQLGIGGQAMSVPHMRRLLAARPDLRLLNCYGPSESTTNTTLHRLTRMPDEAAVSVPIGRPVGDTRVYVLGTEGELLPVGVPGELHIGGRGLARGYLHQPGLTADRFVPDRHGPPGERVYRTGDLVRWLPDGTLDFLDRDDDQVKIRGYRIEPGEVAAAVRRHPGVRDAHTVRHGQGAAAELAAYAVPLDPDGFDPAEVLRFLRRQLPAYMVPATLTALPELPLTANGKVDRARLPEPVRPGGGGGRPPRTATEKAVHAVWAQVLERDGFGVDDDFFAAGGNSFQATRVVAQLRAELGVALPVRTIFEHPSVAELAAAAEQAPSAAPDSPGAPALLPRPAGTAAPLSLAQQRLWFLDQLHPGGADYNVPTALWLDGPLDTGALHGALADAVGRHEVLRSRFALGADRLPVQIAEPPQAYRPEQTDLSHLPETAAIAEARAAAQAEARLPFRLDRGPLIRTRLLRVAPERHLLSVVLHHAAADAESFRLLFTELAGSYAARTGGAPHEPAALPVQYGDYARWQRALPLGADGADDAGIGYWRGRLADLPELRLPADRPRPKVRSAAGGRLRAPLLGPAEAERLGEVARSHGATDFMVLLAALQAALGRIAGQSDFAVGTPVSLRSRPELAPLIGFFVNTLVLRADLSGDPPFAELLARTRASALDGFAHQDVPFDRLVEELLPSRSLGRNPLFDVVFSVDDTAGSLPALPGVRVRAEDVDTGTAKFDLDVAAVRASDGGWSCTVEYSADLFDPPTAAVLPAAFRETLRAALADPARRLSDLGGARDPAPPTGVQQA
ncbi:MAG: amino acid adenylation domain-containing protein, partial [Streptomyces sp.]|nr:amino acid adenylation domain-containing protein [Streptomyces sp.]